MQQSPKPRSFNPHPTRRSGATCATRHPAGCGKVSILTRPEGRVQLNHDGSTVGFYGFQSSPDPKVGCNERWGAMEPILYGFQSSPDPKVGCNRWSRALNSEGDRFQSSPDPKVGCNASLQEPSNLLAFADLLGEPARPRCPRADTCSHRPVAKRGATYVLHQWRTSRRFGACLGFAHVPIMP